MPCFKYTEFFFAKLYFREVSDTRVKGAIICGVMLFSMVFVLDCG
jgi:hypothetical protein